MTDVRNAAGVKVGEVYKRGKHWVSYLRRDGQVSRQVYPFHRTKYAAVAAVLEADTARGRIGR